MTSLQEENERLESFLQSRVIAVLENSGMSQREVAEGSGLSETSISNYLKGKRTPGAVELFRLAKVLNVSMDTFFPDRNEPDAKRQAQAIGAMDRFKKVVNDAVQTALHELAEVAMAPASDEARVSGSGRKLTRQKASERRNLIDPNSAEAASLALGAKKALEQKDS